MLQHKKYTQTYTYSYVLSPPLPAGRVWWAEKISTLAKRGGGLALFEFLGGGVSKKGGADFFRGA